jgi:molybdenum cofactor cytidylyltransferase
MNSIGFLTFSAVMLAAGTSSRMQGRHKLLLPIGDEPVIRRSVRALLEAGPEEIVVVTGFNGRAVMAALDGLPVTFQFNPRYQEGQMTSVAAGVGALSAPCNVVLVCLADQVLLTADDYRELVEAYGAMPHGSILVPFYRGRRGNPVAFSVNDAAEVASGHVNPGCRKLIEEHPEAVVVHEATHDRFAVDMDTPEDYASILARLTSTPQTACSGV